MQNHRPFPVTVGAVLIVLLVGCSSTPASDEPFRLWGSTTLPGAPCLGVVTIRETFPDGELHTISQPPVLLPIRQTGLRPFEFGDGASTRDAPKDHVVVFWEMAEDDEGNGVFRYLYLVRGKANWFLLVDSAGKVTVGNEKVEPDLDERTIPAVMVAREEILEAVDRTGSRVLFLDGTDGGSEIRAMSIVPPILPSEQLKDSNRREIGAAFADGVAMTLARNLESLPKHAGEKEESP